MPESIRRVIWPCSRLRSRLCCPFARVRLPAMDKLNADASR